MQQPANPQVDVLIPTYNPKKEHLREALDALLAQTFTNWKALIHDDASSFDVESVVKPYLEDKRFTFIRSDKNLGIGGNWNACFAKTSAPFVAYLFQDDTWMPTYLENALRTLAQQASVGFVAMDHTYEFEGNTDNNEDYSVIQVIKKQRFSPGFHDGKKFLQQWMEDRLWPNLIGEPDFVVMSREVMKRAGPFKESMPQLLDAEYWVRMLTMSNLYHFTKHSGSFRIHPQAATAKNRERGKALFDRFKTMDDLIKKMPPGPQRKAALKAQVKQFKMMAEKYRKKRDRGDTIRYEGVGCLKKFCMRHPFVTARELLRSRK